MHAVSVGTPGNWLPRLRLQLQLMFVCLLGSLTFCDCPVGLKHCYGTREFWEESDTGANWLFFFFSFSLLLKF